MFLIVNPEALWRKDFYKVSIDRLTKETKYYSNRVLIPDIKEQNIYYQLNFMIVGLTIVFKEDDKIYYFEYALPKKREDHILIIAELFFKIGSLKKVFEYLSI